MHEANKLNSKIIMAEREEEKSGHRPARTIKERMREAPRSAPELSQLPRHKRDQNTRDLMQMSLAVMPLTVSDELRKRKKIDTAPAHAADKHGGRLMVKHPVYKNLLEAARTSNTQGHGTNISRSNLPA